MAARQSMMQPEHDTLNDVGPPAPGDAEPTRDEPGSTPDTAASDTDQTAGEPIGLAVSGAEPTATGAADTPFWSVPELTGTSTLPGLLMAAGVLIMLFILMGRLRKGRRASAPNPATPGEQIAAIRARAGDRGTIEAFKVDAQDFTRQMAAILDTKAERLEQLIADADDRLARLEQARHPPDRPAPSSPDSRPVRVGVTGPAERVLDPVHERVYRMADDGLGPVEIAQKTGHPTGQIELILALRS